MGLGFTVNFRVIEDIEEIGLTIKSIMKAPLTNIDTYYDIKFKEYKPNISLEVIILAYVSEANFNLGGQPFDKIEIKIDSDNTDFNTYFSETALKVNNQSLLTRFKAWIVTRDEFK